MTLPNKTKGNFMKRGRRKFFDFFPRWSEEKKNIGSCWEESPAGGLPRTTPNLNILMARVSAMTLPGGKFTAVICHRKYWS